MSWELMIDEESVNTGVSKLQDICERVMQRKKDLSLIEDSFSEGDFYDEYTKSITELMNAMDKIEQAIRGYINIVKYSAENYKTMDEEMSLLIRRF